MNRPVCWQNGMMSPTPYVFRGSIMMKKWATLYESCYSFDDDKKRFEQASAREIAINIRESILSGKLPITAALLACAI